MLYGFSIQPTSNYLSYKSEKDYIRSRPTEEKITLDVVAVLSGGSYDIKPLNTTFPGESTTVRLGHAVRMYKEHNAKYLVCSGRSDSKTADAELMAQMAKNFGVPKERIRIDARSRNTYEHAVEFNKMFVDKDIKIGLVTSAYHMKRSEAQFRKYFGNIIPLPSNYLLCLTRRHFRRPVYSAIPMAFQQPAHSQRVYRPSLVPH